METNGNDNPLRTTCRSDWRGGSTHLQKEQAVLEASADLLGLAGVRLVQLEHFVDLGLRHLQLFQGVPEEEADRRMITADPDGITVLIQRGLGEVFLGTFDTEFELLHGPETRAEQAGIGQTVLISHFLEGAFHHFIDFMFGDFFPREALEARGHQGDQGDLLGQVFLSLGVFDRTGPAVRTRGEAFTREGRSEGGQIELGHGHAFYERSTKTLKKV